MSNSTDCQQVNNITQYTNVTFAGLTLFASAVLLILKKDGLFDRFLPRSLPRKQTLRKLHEVDTQLGHIIIQLTNLTPQNSTDSNASDERLHSSAGFRSNRHSDRDEDVQRMRMCEEGACIKIQQQAPAVLEESCGIRDSGGARAEPRRWHRETELLRTTDARWDQASHRSGSRSVSASRHDQPGQRQTLRASAASQRRSSDQSGSSTASQEGLQATHRL